MPSKVEEPKTLYDKVLANHIVNEESDGTVLIYIDRHLVHEVTSPQAFEGLRNAARRVRRQDLTLATTDHNVPTTSRKNFKSIADFVEEDESKVQCMTLEENVKEFGLKYFGLGDKRQGIVHVIGPEQGFTLPGLTIVCGDSHTASHGAFGSLAFGIGTSEVEHVLATQCLLTKRSKNMRIRVEGQLGHGVSSKDVILHIIGVIGTAGATGHVIEYSGSAIESLSMEARMSICNMSIEAGARAGMIAPDKITFEYLKGRPLAPKPDTDEWDRAVKYWSRLRSDAGAIYDKDILVDAKDIVPTVTWGTSPEDVVPITGKVPDPESFDTPAKRDSARQALEYMDLKAGTPMEDIVVDKIFIGSCTNSRIEDLRAAARILEGKKIAPNLKRAMVVPGSGLVKQQAEREGLDKIFEDAGFEWREAGCSMCLGMNPDILSPRERCASTSNRNFEGRQGAHSRTHLVSPVMAAAAALAGKLADVRKLDSNGIAPVKADPKVNLVSEKPEVDFVNTENTMDLPEDGRQTGHPMQGTGIPTGLRSFHTLKGIAAPMDRSNVDTDAIIPKQFLKTIKRSGLGSALFHAWRYNDDGSENPDFVLNREPYRKARILVVTGPNFGCGSSREHSVWSLSDFGVSDEKGKHGILSVIAPSFGDIFYNNSFKNGVLPIALSDETALERVVAVARDGKEIEIDLPNQVIRDEEGNKLANFDVEEFRKYCLLNGFDDIALTLQNEQKIKKYEERMARETSWVGDAGYLRRGTYQQPTRIEAVPVPKTNRGEELTEPLDW